MHIATNLYLSGFCISKRFSAPSPGLPLRRGVPQRVATQVFTRLFTSHGKRPSVRATGTTRAHRANHSTAPPADHLCSLLPYLAFPATQCVVARVSASSTRHGWNLQINVTRMSDVCNAHRRQRAIMRCVEAYCESPSCHLESCFAAQLQSVFIRFSDLVCGG